MSKHSERRERRDAYHQMLDAELNDPKLFKRRVVGTLDHQGRDIAPDGRPIRADFWRYRDSRRGDQVPTHYYIEKLVTAAINSLHPDLPGRQVPLPVDVRIRDGRKGCEGAMGRC